MGNTRFDELFAAGREAVLSGRASRQEPPADGQPRWGVSVILRPDAAAARGLERVTAEAMAVSGDGHWPTGAARSSHFTVRALEPHRAPIPPDDERAARYGAATRAAAAQVGPVTLRLTGLTLTPGSVMLRAEPEDGTADRFAHALAEALGDDAAFEAGLHRDIWYANLVHFTAPPADPPALVDWVAARRDTDLGASTHPYAELAAWRFDGTQTVPRLITRAAFAAAG